MISFQRSPKMEHGSTSYAPRIWFPNLCSERKHCSVTVCPHVSVCTRLCAYACGRRVCMSWCGQMCA